MVEKAEYYNKEGQRLLQAGKLEDALAFFTKAIELDPGRAESYHNRGQAYLMMDRIIEGNTDISKAKELRSGMSHKKERGPTPRISFSEIDSVYDSVFPEDASGNENDPLDFDHSFYDYVFSDDALETDAAWDNIVQPDTTGDGFPAILELLNGERLEAPEAVLFKPTKGDVSLIRKDGYVERVVPFEQLGCIRMAGLPEEMVLRRDASCFIEIIETMDGNVYHECIHPDQDRDDLLIGFSTKEQTRFVYSLFPKANIRNRRQERLLGDILLEKQFVAGNRLKAALEEYQKTKSMRLGEIIAQRAHIFYSVIEAELDRAREENVKGLKTGEILLSAGIVDEQQVLDALDIQEKIHNMKIGEFLVQKGIIQEREIYIALAEKFRIPFVDLRQQRVPKKILLCLPRNLIVENEILPLSLENGTIRVATLCPDASYLSEVISQHCNCKHVDFVLAQPTHLKNVINLLYKKIGIGR